MRLRRHDRDGHQPVNSRHGPAPEVGRPVSAGSYLPRRGATNVAMADDLFSVELALDRLEGELDAELPMHVRGFAFAFAENQPTPAVPAAAQHAASLEL